MPLAAERERVATLIFYGVLLLLGYLLFRVFQPFFVPLAWAAVLAIFVYPWQTRFTKRFGRTRAAALNTLIVTVLIIGPGLLVLTAFAREATAAFSNLDRETISARLAWAQRSLESVRVAIPGTRRIDLGEIVDQASARMAAFVAARAGGLLADIALFVFNLFVTLFALFFLLRDAGATMRGMRRVLPFDEARRELMIRQTHDLVYASITSGLTIAALQGLLGGLLFALLGLDAPVFWGVVMGFFSLLPFFGAWVVWLPAAIWLMATGNMTKGLILIGVGAGIVGSVDNILRPALLSGRAQMNGLLMFVSLLGGVSVFGLLGLVLGPLVVALTSGLLEAYTASAEIEAALRHRKST